MVVISGTQSHSGSAGIGVEQLELNHIAGGAHRAGHDDPLADHGSQSAGSRTAAEGQGDGNDGLLVGESQVDLGISSDVLGGLAAAGELQSLRAGQGQGEGHGGEGLHGSILLSDDAVVHTGQPAGSGVLDGGTSAQVDHEGNLVLRLIHDPDDLVAQFNIAGADAHAQTDVLGILAVHTVDGHRVVALGEVNRHNILVVDAGSHKAAAVGIHIEVVAAAQVGDTLDGTGVDAVIVPVAVDVDHIAGIQIAVGILGVIQLVEAVTVAAPAGGGVAPAAGVAVDGDLGLVIGVGLVSAPLVVQAVHVTSVADGLAGVVVHQGDALVVADEAGGLDNDHVGNPVVHIVGVGVGVAGNGVGRADVVSLDGGQILVAVVVGNGTGLNNVELGVNSGVHIAVAVGVVDAGIVVIDLEVTHTALDGFLLQLDIVHSVGGEVVEADLALENGLAGQAVFLNPALGGLLDGLASNPLVEVLVAVAVGGQLGGGVQHHVVAVQSVGGHVGEAEAADGGAGDRRRVGGLLSAVIHIAVVEHAEVVGRTADMVRVLGPHRKDAAAPIGVEGLSTSSVAGIVAALEAGVAVDVAQVGDGGLQVVELAAVAAVAAGPSGVAGEDAAVAVGNNILLGLGVAGSDLSDPLVVLDVVEVLVAGGVHLGQQGVLAALSQLIGTDVAELIEVHVVLDSLVHHHDVVVQLGLIEDLGLALLLTVGGSDGHVLEVLGLDGVGDDVGLPEAELTVDNGVVHHVAHDDVVEDDTVIVGVAAQAQGVELQGVLVGVNSAILPVLHLEDVLGLAVAVVVDHAQALAVVGALVADAGALVEVLLNELLPAQLIGLVHQGGGADVDFADGVVTQTVVVVLVTDTVSGVEDFLHDLNVGLGDVVVGTDGDNPADNLVVGVNNAVVILVPSNRDGTLGDGVAVLAVDVAHVVRPGSAAAVLGNGVTNQVVRLVEVVVVLVVVQEEESAAGAQAFLLGQLGNVNLSALVEGNLVDVAHLQLADHVGLVLDIGVVGQTHGVQLAAGLQGHGLAVNQHLGVAVGQDLVGVLVDVRPLVGHHHAGDALQAQVLLGQVGAGALVHVQGVVLLGLGEDGAEEDLSDHLTGGGGTQRLADILGDAQGLSQGADSDGPAGAGELTVAAVTHSAQDHRQHFVAGDVLAGLEGPVGVALDVAGVGAVVDVAGVPAGGDVRELASAVPRGVDVLLGVGDIAGGDAVDDGGNFSAGDFAGGAELSAVVVALEDLHAVEDVDRGFIRVVVRNIREGRGTGGSHEREAHNEGQHQGENLLEISHGG